MINNDYLTRLNQCLEKLDKSEWTKVSYDPTSFTLIMLQRGRRVDLTPVKGLIKAKSKVALLSPQDLIDLMHEIDFLIQYPDQALMAPIDLGYRIYIADLKIYDEPRLLTELKFYSIKNKLLLWFIKLFNKRLKMILNM